MQPEPPQIAQVAFVFSMFEKQFDSPAHQRQIEAMTVSMSIEDIRRK